MARSVAGVGTKGTMTKLTRQQAAEIGAFTGVLCGPFEDLHEYVERIMQRPVFTHEMGNELTMAQIKERAEADFISLCPTKEQIHD